MTYRDLPRWMRIWIVLAFVLLVMCFLLFGCIGVMTFLERNDP